MLSKRQKSVLCQLARQAWEVAPEREALLAANPDMSASAVFEAWRHVEQGKAIGRQSLRHAVNDDYLPLKAHWEMHLGRGKAAMRDMLKADSEDRRRLRWVLQRECRQRDLSWPGYPAAICQRQNKCGLDEASERQLMRLIYTVRNRRPKAQTRSDG